MGGELSVSYERVLSTLYSSSHLLFSPFLPAPLGASAHSRDYMSFFYIFVLFVKRSGFLFYIVDEFTSKLVLWSSCPLATCLLVYSFTRQLNYIQWLRCASPLPVISHPFGVGVAQNTDSVVFGTI